MDGKIYTVTAAIADLVNSPDNGANIGKRDSQLLFGETVELIPQPRHNQTSEGKYSEGWNYVKSNMDGYTGFVKSSALNPHNLQATHFINRPWTHIYPEPSCKTRPVMGAGLMSRFIAGENKDGFINASGTGWLWAEHAKPLSDLTADTEFVETALKFLGCPYLYGGRSALRLDCSALVQLGLMRSGIPCPRDSNEQEEIGRATKRDDLRRGDLVFFKGHVGIMTDGENILNATSRTMDVRIEKLNELEKAYIGITAIRRI